MQTRHGADALYRAARTSWPVVSMESTIMCIQMGLMAFPVLGLLLHDRERFSSSRRRCTVAGCVTRGVSVLHGRVAVRVTARGAVRDRLLFKERLLLPPQLLLPPRIDSHPTQKELLLRHQVAIRAMIPGTILCPMVSNRSSMDRPQPLHLRRFRPDKDPTNRSEYGPVTVRRRLLPLPIGLLDHLAEK